MFPIILLFLFTRFKSLEQYLFHMIGDSKFLPAPSEENLPYPELCICIYSSLKTSDDKSQT